MDSESPELEQLTDTLRAESNGKDLTSDGINLTILAQRADGTRYPLGHVDLAVWHQRPEDLRAAIDVVKFSPLLNGATDGHGTIKRC